MSVISIQEPNAGVGPSGIPGLCLWLDASDESTITLDGAGNVSNWADLSPSGNDLSAGLGDRPTYVSGEINGLNVVEFDSVNEEFMNTSPVPVVSGFPFTCFIAALSLTDGNNRDGSRQILLWAGDNTIGDMSIIQVAIDLDSDAIDDFIPGELRINARSPDGIPDDSITGTNRAGWEYTSSTKRIVGEPFIARFNAFDGLSANASLSNLPGRLGRKVVGINRGNEVIPQSGINSLDIGRLGQTNTNKLWCDAQFCEIILFQTILNYKTTQDIMRYLATKWSIKIL